LPGRQAAVAALIGAWLLLPPYVLRISDFPDYSKNTAAAIGLVLGTLIFQPHRIMSFRPQWFDLPMLAWCVCGMATSLHNGLGWYDGLSDSLQQFLWWGAPYLVGRLYFDDLVGLRELAVGITIGGLAYVLPCFFEFRMSALLLPGIYGFGPPQGGRWGFMKARVFFLTGLECSLWMMGSSLVSWWLWRCSV